MLRGGTTCANENYFFPDVQAATYTRHGFRALVGLPVIDFPTAWAQDLRRVLRQGRATSTTHGATIALVGTAFAPHAPYTVTDANFERIRDSPTSSTSRCTCTCTRPRRKSPIRVAQSGQRPIARLDRLGLVNDRLIAVHMTQLTDAEIALCAERGVCVVHCPESNLKLASGFCPVGKLQRAGVNIGIGTDGCASNNDLDMFGEMRTAALLAKAVANDASALDAASALRAATLGGARALGLGDRIGSIEPGKQADLACVDLDGLETQPLHHVISQLVYATGRHQVSDVWIAGRAKLRERVLVDMDPDAHHRQCAPVARTHRRHPDFMMTTQAAGNFRQSELDNFDALAARWWDPHGPQKAAACAEPGAAALRRRPHPAGAARACSTSAAAAACSARRWRAPARRSPRSTWRRSCSRSRACMRLETGVDGRLPRAAGRRGGRRDAGRVRRRHLHGNARARAGSGGGDPRLRRRAQARRPPVRVDPQPHAGRVRAGDRRRRIRRAPAAEGHAPVPRLHRRPSWRPGCARAGCELEDVSGLPYEPCATPRGCRAAPTSTTSPARASRQ